MDPTQLQTAADNTVARADSVMRYRSKNAGHDVRVRLLFPMMGRQWMCEVIEKGSRFPIGERLLLSLDDLRQPTKNEQRTTNAA